MRLPEECTAKKRHYPQKLISSLMTLAKLYGHRAYAELPSFVHSHIHLLPFLDLHRVPDKLGDFTPGGAQSGSIALSPAEAWRGLRRLCQSGVAPLALGKPRPQPYKTGGTPGVDGQRDLRAHLSMSPVSSAAVEHVSPDVIGKRRLYRETVW